MAFLSFLIVVALVVCHNPKQLPEEKSEELPVFNLEAVAEETVPSAFMWNDITEKATFIPLSSDEKTLLSGSLGITFMDNEYIVIVDYKTGSFYRYGVDGKVQRSFKYEGNGPGEYVYISYLYVDPGYAFMDIYDSGNRKRIRYDWEGNLLEERELVDIVAPVFATEHYMVSCGMPETEYQYFIADLAMNVYRKDIRMGEGYDEIKRSAVQILTSTCQNKDMFIFSRPMSDTVYRITDKALEPLFILKKGKYDIKYEELGRFMTREMKTMKCLMWTRISSLPEYYLIDYKQGEHQHSEIWSKKEQTIVARVREKNGLPFRLSLGKEITLPTERLCIKGKTVIVPVPAEELEGDINGVTADDNPVLLVLELR